MELRHTDTEWRHEDRNRWKTKEAHWMMEVSSSSLKKCVYCVNLPLKSMCVLIRHFVLIVVGQAV